MPYFDHWAKQDGRRVEVLQNWLGDAPDVGSKISVVEAMHFGKAVLAFDCNYNRSTTEDKALFFCDSKELQQLVESLDKSVAEKVGRDMLEIANRRYTWHIVAEQYFSLLNG